MSDFALVSEVKESSDWEDDVLPLLQTSPSQIMSKSQLERLDEESYQEIDDASDEWSPENEPKRGCDLFVSSPIKPPVKPEFVKHSKPSETTRIVEDILRADDEDFGSCDDCSELSDDMPITTQNDSSFLDQLLECSHLSLPHLVKNHLAIYLSMSTQPKISKVSSIEDAMVKMNHRFQLEAHFISCLLTENGEITSSLLRKRHASVQCSECGLSQTFHQYWTNYGCRSYGFVNEEIVQLKDMENSQRRSLSYLQCSHCKKNSLELYLDLMATLCETTDKAHLILARLSGQASSRLFNVSSRDLILAHNWIPGRVQTTLEFLKHSCQAVGPCHKRFLWTIEAQASGNNPVFRICQVTLAQRSVLTGVSMN